MMTDSDPSTLGLDNASAPPNLSQSPTSYGSSHDEEATSSSTSTSGYGTEPIAAGIGRSDTLENIDEPKDRIKTSAVHGNGTGHANGSVHPICDNQAASDSHTSTASAPEDTRGGSPPRGYTVQPVYESLDADVDENASEFINIRISEPRKTGEGMGSYVVYKVYTKTNASYFKSSEFSVSRRFSDFLGLQQKLTEKYLHLGRIIPPAPQKDVVGTTKIKMAKEGDTEVHDEFVERRRAALERYINRTALHPSLKADPDFREFLELDSELPKSTQTSTLSGKTMMKLINKVGDSLSNMNLKMEERDEWFEEKIRSVDLLDEQFRKLHVSTEALAFHRKHLALSAGNISKSLAGLSGCENSKDLSGALAKLSDVQRTMENIHTKQSTADYYLLSELIKDYIGLIGAVKDAFQERVKAWQGWQSATSNLTKKREAKVKAEMQQRMEKVFSLRQEISDLERTQEMAQENFDRISRLIKKEVEMFDLQKTEDFKDTIMHYLDAMAKSQEAISIQWEQHLPNRL